MEKYTAREARESFSEIISKAEYGSQRVVVTKNGRDSVAIVPIADLELLAELERLIDVTDAESAIAEARMMGTTTLEALKKKLGM
jgi:prevent-host-death family protein